MLFSEDVKTNFMKEAKRKVQSIDIFCDGKPKNQKAPRKK
jgi:hypothetical protein